MTRPSRSPSLTALARAGAAVALAAASLAAAAAPAALLNASYDVTREFYKDYDAAFVAHWKQASGETLVVNQSHAGSSQQARSVINGLEADVVTMNQASDIDLIAERGNGLLPTDWAKRFPNDSAPTTSVQVILVRKGNPRGIHDWADLARPGLGVVIPNPKTSGNGRYGWLAIWGSAVKGGATPAQARDLAARVFANVPVFDGGGRAATTTFAQRGIGDALVTFESETAPIRAEFGGDFEVIYPKRTVLAENPVAVVDAVALRHGTTKQAQAYLGWLYSDDGQEIAARHGLRPRSAKVLAAHAKDFPQVETFTVGEVFGGWKSAQKTHFDDGGTVDQALAAQHKQ